MRRGEVWWARLSGAAGRRPVVLVSRDEACAVRSLVTAAPVTTRLRGLPVEIPLGAAEGLPRPCIANVDTMLTISKARLERRAGVLGPLKLVALDRAIRFALGLRR